MRFTIFLILAVLFISCSSKSSIDDMKTIGSIEKLDPRLDDIISTDSPIEVLGEGYSWTEGPVWIEKEQILLWSDVPENIIYSWKSGGKAEVYLTPSGYTGEEKREGSNGLLLSPEGELVICQHGDRRVAMMDAPISNPQPQFKTLADRYDGKRFNSPNDAAFDEGGNLYFTDPPYGLPGQDESPDKEINFSGVYRLSVDGDVTLMDDQLKRPNGIAFSPDFSKCYVANSDSENAIWKVYDVDENGVFQNGRVFFDATAMASKDNPGLPDGMCVNKDGIVFGTGPGGVLIFTPDGEHLGTIRPETATANCTFNDDQTVLFMTANMYMTRVQLK